MVNMMLLISLQRLCAAHAVVELEKKMLTKKEMSKMKKKVNKRTK